jgi:hypothetical protein
MGRLVRRQPLTGRLPANFGCQLAGLLSFQLAQLGFKRNRAIRIHQIDRGLGFFFVQLLTF